MVGINEIVEVMQVVKKGHFLNVLDQLNIQLNEQSTAGYNRIFERIIHCNRSR